MLKDYYYTDKDELDALRVECSKLRQELIQAKAEIENLRKQCELQVVIMSRGAGRKTKGGKDAKQEN